METKLKPESKDELYGVLAEFDTPGALIEAAKKVKGAGYTRFDCYSPFPVHGIDDAMGIKRTILPLIVFCGGVSGLIGGFFLQWWMNAYNWPFWISGKPTWSIPANVPIGFETTILLSVFTTFFGMWILNQLPQVWHPFFKLDRFVKVTDDGFFLGIEAKDGKFDAAKTKALLEGAHALAVEECYVETGPAATKMPSFIMAFIVATGALAVIPLALIYRAMNSTSTEPHVHIFSDMDFQPKAKSDVAFNIFGDGRANRGAIDNTVARGDLRSDDAYYRGLSAGQWITGLPEQVKVSQQLIERGQERFNIYCAPCHGYDGRGHGAVPQRLTSKGFEWKIRDLVDPTSTVITMPNGQLFNTISNGFATMAGYAGQIPVEDRWAIVLYVRALGRAFNASASDGGPL